MFGNSTKKTSKINAHLSQGIHREHPLSFPYAAWKTGPERSCRNFLMKTVGQRQPFPSLNGRPWNPCRAPERLHGWLTPAAPARSQQEGLRSPPSRGGCWVQRTIPLHSPIWQKPSRLAIQESSATNLHLSPLVLATPPPPASSASGRGCGASFAAGSRSASPKTGKNKKKKRVASLFFHQVNSAL